MGKKSRPHLPLSPGLLGALFLTKSKIAFSPKTWWVGWGGTGNRG